MSDQAFHFCILFSLIYIERLGCVRGPQIQEGAQSDTAAVDFILTLRRSPSLRSSEEVHGIEVGQVVPLYLPVDDEPQFPRIPLVDDGPAHPKIRRGGPRLSTSSRPAAVMKVNHWDVS